jgi:ubiquinone/menaquinone biosynthesis C-methylase UbiE
MMTRQANTQRDAVAWAQFWEDEGSDAHVVNSEADAQALRAAWRPFLEGGLSSGGRCRILDVACGNAVVAEQAVSIAAEHGGAQQAICCDYSEAAVRAAVRRLDGASVSGIVADAARLPVPDQSLDIVVSQYGVEYAGATAFAELARVVAPGGAVQAIVHRVGGVIDRRCQDDEALLLATLDSGVFKSFMTLLKIRHKAAQAGLEPAAAKPASARFARSVERVETARDAAGLGAARSHVARLLTDLGRVAANPLAYRLDEMEQWVEGQRHALRGFANRMQSMSRAARDEGQVAILADFFREGGLSGVSVASFDPAHHRLSAGWILRGHR